ncbi:hypothetical protein CHS0354_000999 [Potamilus streckersoni]|uniref:Glutathione S-transferase n=1 Tax=Potamilus streckersoni TaxID=2493646 RepID=A0AAE0TF29_9BIVA|nr:hypothetical protein CHS0354_000999 [Potamilus streckersoni]
MPLQVMPVLEIDGKKFCQSAAISRMIARDYGLYGVDVTEALRIDEIYEAVGDAIREIAKPFYEKDEEKKTEISKNLWEVVFPKFLRFFEMRLSENEEKSGFLVGNKLSIADLALFNVLDIAEGWHGSPLLGNNPTLQALTERIKAVPEIAAWMEKRPVTDH